MGAGWEPGEASGLGRGSNSRSCIGGIIIGQQCISISRFILSIMYTVIQLEYVQTICCFIQENSQKQCSWGTGSAGDCQMSQTLWDPGVAESLVPPGWSRHLCQTQQHDLPTPHSPSRPCPLQVLGSRSAGEGWRRKGQWIEEGQMERVSNGDIFWYLHPADALCNSRGIHPPSRGFGWRKDLFWRSGSLALNCCCSPRWEKPELTQEQQAEVKKAVPKQPRTEKTLPCQFLLKNRS